jgi:hypothetical protein
MGSTKGERGSRLRFKRVKVVTKVREEEKDVKPRARENRLDRYYEIHTWGMIIFLGCMQVNFCFGQLEIIRGEGLLPGGDECFSSSNHQDTLEGISVILCVRSVGPISDRRVDNLATQLLTLALISPLYCVLTSSCIRNTETSVATTA